MCKIQLLRKSLFDMREVLKRYTTLVPSSQLSRYEKDLAMIFSNFDEKQSEIDLLKTEKLAKTKLKSIQRIYGELREEKAGDTKSVSFIDDETESYLKKQFNVDINEKYKSKFDEIKRSPGFNPELVKQYQEHYHNEKARIQEAYLKVVQERLDLNEKNKQKSIENIIMQGKDINLSKCRDKNGKLIKSKVKEAVSNIFKMNGFTESEADNFDYTDILSNLQKNEDESVSINNTGIKIQNDVEDNNFTDVSKSENLFSVFNKSKEMTEEELNKFKDKVAPILNDKNISDEDKKKIYLEELKKADKEFKINNFDGEISYDMYGQFKFNFYKEKNEEEKSNTTTNDSSIEQKVENEAEAGTKNYVWRNGQLVEGKAQERKVVTYSNWHAGHHNPDDLRKHRELLDRQHYGGPLWEGIKYVGNLSKGQTEHYIAAPTREDIENLEKNQVKFSDKDGKKEIIEIIR
jgi:hypothetical protein